MDIENKSTKKDKGDLEIWTQNSENYEQMKENRKKLIQNIKKPNLGDCEEIDRKFRRYTEISQKKQQEKDNGYFQSYYNDLIKDKKDDDQYTQIQKLTEFHSVTKGGFFNSEYDNNEYVSNFNPNLYAPNRVIKHKEEVYDQLILRAMKENQAKNPISSAQQQNLRNQTLQQIKNKNLSLQQHFNK